MSETVFATTSSPINPPTRTKANGYAAGRYSQMFADREPYLRRARRLADLTIPSLFRDRGDTGFTDADVPWTSVGAYSVRNLANKMMLSLYPAGVPWIKLKLPREVIADINALGEQAGEIRADLASALSVVEQEFVEEIEADGDRRWLFSAVLHLIVGGNHGLHRYPDTGLLRGIPLDRYVTHRAPDGALLEFCIKDSLSFDRLDDDIKEVARRQGFDDAVLEKGHKPQIVDVYTYGVWRNKRWHVHQEIGQEVIESTKAVYTEKTLPYMFLGFNWLEGEHYARSYVEDYEGDLQSVDGLAQIVQEGTAAAALLIRLVSPNGVTSKRAIEQATNGAVITGSEADVGTLTSQKSADFQAANNLVDSILGRLSRAFLLNSAVQRGGERVTAEEIRFVARELEDQLGGAYSNQVVQFQMPYARLKFQSLQKQRRITRIPEDAINLTIITGAAALGRQAELQTLDTFLLGGAQVLAAIPPFTIDDNIYMKRRAAALGVDTEGLVLTPEQRQAKLQEQQQQQLAQQVAPELVRQGGESLREQSAGEQVNNEG